MKWMSRSVMKTFDENVRSIWNLKLYFLHVKCNLPFVRNLTYLLWKYDILRIAHSIQKFSFKFFPSDSNGYTKTPSAASFIFRILRYSRYDISNIIY